MAGRGQTTQASAPRRWGGRTISCCGCGSPALPSTPLSTYRSVSLLGNIYFLWIFKLSLILSSLFLCPFRFLWQTVPELHWWWDTVSRKLWECLPCPEGVALHLCLLTCVLSLLIRTDASSARWMRHLDLTHLTLHYQVYYVYLMNIYTGDVLTTWKIACTKKC